MLSFSGLGASEPALEASGLHDTNLNTLSTQTPRGQKLHEYIKGVDHSKKSLSKFHLNMFY